MAQRLRRRRDFTIQALPGKTGIRTLLPQKSAGSDSAGNFFRPSRRPCPHHSAKYGSGKVPFHTVPEKYRPDASGRKPALHQRIQGRRRFFSERKPDGGGSSRRAARQRGFVPGFAGKARPVRVLPHAALRTVISPTPISRRHFI